MAYTFWHCGILIGESELDEMWDHPRQRGGMFRPTEYGLSIFPRLTGILTAMHALKGHIDANGLSADALATDEIEELLDTTPAGQKIIDVGRALSDVEVRGSDGRRLEFTSIAFSDVLELQRLVREMELDSAETLNELPADVPHYIVSATFCEEVPDLANATTHRGVRFRRGPWRPDN
jgi:hypothetical protein